MQPKLKSFTSSCCCLVCLLSCACEGCVIHRYKCPQACFESKKLVIECKRELQRLDRKERKEFFINKLRGFKLVVTITGRYYYTWVIGAGEQKVIVCRDGFETAYGLSSWYVDDLISRLKNGDVNADLLLNDRSVVEKSGINDVRVVQFCKLFNISLSRMQLRAIKVPNTLSSLTTVAWMNYFFRLIGDNVPNAKEELHLEPTKKKTVYEEYCADIAASGDCCSPVTLSLFLDLWNQVFSYVKIRRFKQCCGKCNLCARLSELRRQFTDIRGREEVSRLFVLHRCTYMGERELYYARRNMALMEPWDYLSTITDGMQQNRCLIPWYGHQKPPPVHIKQHLQGVLMHGRMLRIYRSFSNVSVNGNYCVYTWLLSLEEIYKDKGKLPSTLYHQIDGGSENANKITLAMAYLMVAKGLTQKIVMTRLPPGHTHEDIDALFALIWNMLKNEIVLTLDEFKRMMYIALSGKKDVKVVDIYACPNFEAWFDGYIDSDFGLFAEQDWTQLQFIFERVDESERDRYPLLVKVSYRAYAQDDGIEIVDDEDHETITGLKPQLTRAPLCPSDDEPPLCVLKALPPITRPITVDPFTSGSRAFTEACAEKMECTYLKKSLVLLQNGRSIAKR